MLVLLQDPFHLAELLKRQTQSFGSSLTPPFFLLPLLHKAERHALLLNAYYFFTDVISPTQNSAA